MRLRNYILLLILLLFAGFNASSQIIKGRVISKKTGQSMPFVTIIINQKKDGLSTDIDGNFSLQLSDKIEFLKFTYLGYKSIYIPAEKIPQKKNWIIRMEEKEIKLNEITVYPDENPAHRIIKKVVENRKLNNPDKLKSYSYTAYHKMVFTIDMDNPIKNKNYKPRKIPQDSLSKLKTDSIKKAHEADPKYRTMDEVFATQDLFLMESVSETKFKQPDLKSEKVIMSRVSGFKQPSFVLLASQFQSFSIYSDMITLADSRYINPISRGSWNKYFFNIEDTTYNECGDTVFIISFRPKKGKNFEALQGILNINTNKYAVQSITAKPTENEGVLGVEIRQNYKLINQQFWFPEELDTKLIFYSMSISNDSLMYYIIANGKSYLKDVKINREILRKEIGSIDFEVKKSAFKQADSLWNKYRRDSLTKKDLRTYHFMDSIGKEHHLDAKLKTVKILAKGYIPIGFINLDLTKLMHFNVFENFRLGLGAHTNDKVIKNINIGGYGAYGFGDKEWKYGAELNFNIDTRHDTKLKLFYKNDVEESSGYEFMETPGLNSTESYRYYFIKDMTYNEQFAFDFQFRPFRRFKLRLNLNQSKQYNPTDYFFQVNALPDLSKKEYSFMETKLQLAYTPHEKLSFIAGELMNSYGSTPAFYANITKGYKNEWGDFDYWKIETKILLSALTKNFGKTNLVLCAAKIFGDLPYFQLYNGHASFYDYTIETANSFATMRMNEFLSDRFAALYFRQDFGGLLFKTKKFKPHLVFATNIGFGNLSKPEIHKNISFKSMKKGYYESGILINNILNSNLTGLGCGVYYRYGAYAFAENKNNFAYKITFTFNL